MNIHQNSCNRQEAMAIYQSLIDGYSSAAITEPRDFGRTLAKTAIALVEVFNEEIETHQHQPIAPLHISREKGDVEMLGHFRVNGDTVEFKLDGEENSVTLIADCKATLTAFEVVKTLERILGID